MRTGDDSETAAVFDFVALYLADLEAGRERALNDYLQRFPAHQPAIAREYLQLTGAREGSPNGAATAAGEPGASPVADAQRVGPYRLLRELGRGGQGAVWLAEDTRIARRVALKILASHFETVSDDRRLRFRREAETVARLEHPGICPIYDADIEGPVPYLAMRLFEGETLSQVLWRTRRIQAGEDRPTGDDDLAAALPPRTTLDVHRVLSLFERCARALHAAHEAGVVHRDVKPGNVMITRDQRPVLLDFGLALDDTSAIQHLTHSGEMFGTPAYMAPEQVRGESDLDRRTDVYSLGVALYEALTLARPFDAQARPVLFLQIANDPVPDARRRNPRLSEDVQVVLETALEKDRARRYATALELAEDLRRIREYEPIRARPAGPLLLFARWTRRHPVLAVAIGSTIASLAGGLVLTQAARLREQRALSFAMARELAERSQALIAEDPSAALPLAMEAVLRADTFQAREALLAALDACRLERVYRTRKADGTETTKAPNVRDAAVSADGTQLALACENGLVHVFELGTGRLLGTIAAHEKPVERLAWSHDGRWLVSVSNQGLLVSTDAATGERAAATPFPGTAAQLETDPGLPRVACLDVDGRARLLALPDLQPVWEEEDVAGLRIAPAGGRLLLHRGGRLADHGRMGIVSTQDGTSAGAGERNGAPPDEPGLTALDVRTVGGVDVVVTGDGRGTLTYAPGTRRTETLQVPAPVAHVALSPGGEWVFFAGGAEPDVEAGLWNPDSSQRLPLRGHGGRAVTDAAFSPDGTRIAVAARDRAVRLYDARTGAEREVLRNIFPPASVRWVLGGTRLLTRPESYFAAYLWFAGSRPDLLELEGHRGPVRWSGFSPDGTLALTADDAGSVRVWKVREEAPLAPGADLGACVASVQRAGRVRGAAFGPGGQVVFAGWEDGSVCAIALGAAPAEPLTVRRASPLAALAVAPDGSGVAALWEDGAAARWTPGAGQPALLAASSPARCLAWAPTGDLIATGDADGAVRVFDGHTGTLLREIATFEDAAGDRRRAVSALAFHPVTGELAVLHEDAGVRFWDARGGRATRDLVRVSMTRSLAFSSDGARLLATGHRGSDAFRVHDLAAGVAAPRELLHTQNLNGAALDASGRLLLTFAEDGRIVVRDVTTGKPIVRRSYAPSITTAAFDPDGARVLHGDARGNVHVWPIDPLPAALARVPRDLELWEIERERNLSEDLGWKPLRETWMK